MKAETTNEATGRNLLRTGPADATAAAAITGLYQGHAVGLIRLAVVMLGDRPAAEDVVQDAFAACTAGGRSWPTPTRRWPTCGPRR